MPAEPFPQLIYVVRLWRTEASGQIAWRVAVQNPTTEERQVFADLEEFFAFFEEQTCATDQRLSDRA